MQMQIIITIFPAACYIYIYISILSSQSQSIEWNMQNTPIYVTLQYRLHHLTRWHDFVYSNPNVILVNNFVQYTLNDPRNEFELFREKKKKNVWHLRDFSPFFLFFFFNTPRIHLNNKPTHIYNIYCMQYNLFSFSIFFADEL